MTSNIGLAPEHYYSPDAYAREHERIFSKLWLFAGLKQFFPRKDSFISRRIAGVPVVIQNTDEGLAAFVNQCPHRQAPIQLKECGARKLTCPYHGWSFDAKGHLAVLPNKHLYNFDAQQQSSIKLRRLGLETVGNFVFVNLNDDPIAITEQFSEKIMEDMRNLSGYFDTQVAYARFPLAHNWKLNVEVIKDPNHIPFVHPRSFGPWQKKPADGEKAQPVPTAWRSVADTTLPDLSFSTAGDVLDSLPWYRPLIKRHVEESRHLSWYFYPNTHFASVRGDYFFIQHYDPVSPIGIDFHLWVFTAARLDAKTDFTAVLRALIGIERSVIEEDAVLLKALQSSLGDWSPAPRHGAYEDGILAQNVWYRENVLDESE